MYRAVLVHRPAGDAATDDGGGACIHQRGDGRGPGGEQLLRYATGVVGDARQRNDIAKVFPTPDCVAEVIGTAWCRNRTSQRRQPAGQLPGRRIGATVEDPPLTSRRGGRGSAGSAHSAGTQIEPPKPALGTPRLGADRLLQSIVA